MTEENAEQYDLCAEKYSEIFVANNRDSLSAYFRHFEMPLRGKKLLDLGCGNGYDLAQMKLKGANIFGIDASKEMVNLALKNNPGETIKVGHFENIPFQEKFFDIVVSKWSFQHAVHIDSIYKEIARVLKSGGEFIYLSSHPFRQFVEKKKKEKNYFQKEIVESVFFGGKMREKAPSHTLNEYLSPLFFQNFSLEYYEEGFDSGAEKVEGDIYPSYFMIKAFRI